MDSTLTMLLFGYGFGKPGFITDPLFDLPKNAMLHAPCLALASPFHGRSCRLRMPGSVHVTLPSPPTVLPKAQRLTI